MCFYKGVDSSCRSRIQWAAGHEKEGTAGEKAPCEAAHVLVISQCDECGGCKMEDAQCEDPSDTMVMKFERPVGGRAASGRSLVAPLWAAGLTVLGLVAVAGVAAGRAFSSRRARRVGAQQYLCAEEQECEAVATAL